MRLIDSHAHLEEIKNLENVLEKAEEVGVIALIAVGSNDKANKEILELSQKIHPIKIYPALGIHPGNIITQEIDTSLDFIKSHIKDLVAIGEIGLDFWYKEAKNPDKKREQIDVFKKQLIIAKDNNLPAIVHSRGAWNECISICKEVEIKKVIFHWYSGQIDILKLMLDAGYFISVTPALEYSKFHQEAARYAPKEQILIETDSPVIFHSSDGDYESTPSDVYKSLKYLAQIKAINNHTLAEEIFNNTLIFFNLAL